MNPELQIFPTNEIPQLGAITRIFEAHPDFQRELVEEIRNQKVPFEQVGPLFFVDETRKPLTRAPAWAANEWSDLVKIEFKSISEAARTLRHLKKRWIAQSSHLFRRTQLILEQTRQAENKKQAVLPGQTLTDETTGIFTLLNETTLVAAQNVKIASPHGEIRFLEDRIEPPSRAYLKLWEVFSRTGRIPQPGERAIDLGASPGSWTWALAHMGVRVKSYDRANLAPHILKLPQVTHQIADAFEVSPTRCEHLDWLVCDVIAEPVHTLSLIRKWIEAGRVNNIVATIKFKGPTDHSIVNRFLEIPNSHVQHLWHNKHELTWWRLSPATRSPLAESSVDW